MSTSYQNPNVSQTVKTTGVINFDKYDEIPVKTTGRECPPPVTSWEDVDLGEGLLRNIEEAGYTKPTPVQKYALPTIVNSRDLMGCAQTGSGKTAAFLLPIISLMLRNRLYDMRDRDRRTANPVALILAPTRELACQILDEAEKFCSSTPIRTAILYGGVPPGEQIRNLFRGCDILVATPGRLTDIIGRQKVSLSFIRFLVLDEADRMLDMGFEPQIRKIVEEFDMPKKEDRQTLMFSATFPKEIRALAASFLKDYVFLTVGRVGSTTELVTQQFVFVSSDVEREQKLLDLLRGSDGLTLIFVETKKKANYLDYFLRRQGISATSIHGDRNQQERTLALRAFSSGMTPILIATNVAARGLDIGGINHVINFEMAANIEDYVHRIGRTGRAGKSGISTTFLSPENSNIIPDLIKLLSDAGQEVPQWIRALDKRGSGNRGGYKPFGRGGFQQRGGFGGNTRTFNQPTYGHQQSNASYQSWNAPASNGWATAPSNGWNSTSNGWGSNEQSTTARYSPSRSPSPPRNDRPSRRDDVPLPPAWNNTGSTSRYQDSYNRDSSDRKRRYEDADGEHRDKYARTDSDRVRSSSKDYRSDRSQRSHSGERSSRDSKDYKSRDHY